MRTNPFIVAISLALASIACGDALETDDGTAEQEKRVRPVGSEQHTTGSVTVKVPAGSPELAPTRLVFRGARKNVEGWLETPIVLPVGKYDLSTQGSNQATVFARIEVKGGAAQTLTLPVLAPVVVVKTEPPPGVSAMKLTWGPTFTPIAGNPRRLDPSIRLAGAGDVYASPIGTGAGIVLVPESSYEVVRPDEVGNLQVIESLDVGASPKIHSLHPVTDAWTAPEMSVATSDIAIRLDASELPVAEEPAITWSCAAKKDTAKNFQTTGKLSGSALLRGGSGAWSASTVKGTVGIPGCKYRVALASGPAELDTSQATADLDVHFLDVEHVHLVHADGTERDVSGKFRLLRVMGPGRAPVALSTFRFPTGKAVAVETGTYRVEVEYQDNSSKQIYATEVTVP